MGPSSRERTLSSKRFQNVTGNGTAEEELKKGDEKIEGTRRKIAQEDEEAKPRLPERESLEVGVQSLLSESQKGGRG